MSTSRALGMRMGMGMGLRLGLAILALSPLVALACGGSEPPPAVPPPTTAPSASASSAVLVSSSNPSDSGAPAATSSAATPPPPSPSALAAILTVDAAQVAAIAAAAASAAAPKMQPASAAKDLAKGLAGAAAKMAAPGMKPEGTIATGTLKEGEHLAWPLSLAPGKCYAIVGYSPSGEIADLDLRLLEPPFYASISGEDESDDNTPVIGGGPNPMCPVAASPLPYKVDITSQKGTGHVGVQVFAKSK